MPVRYTRPSYPDAAPLSTARTTPTYSSIIGSGANGARPNRVFMIVFATPRPRMNRPSVAWSSCAAVLAASTGGRSAAFAIAVPTRTRRVAAATGWHRRQGVAVPLGHEHRAEPGLLGGPGHGSDGGRRQPAVRRDRQPDGTHVIQLPILRLPFLRNVSLQKRLL